MWAVNDITTNFDAETGDAGVIATTNFKVLWFNQGQARLLSYRKNKTTMTWALGATEIALPSDFVQLDKMVGTVGNSGWDVWEPRGREFLEYVPRGDYTTGAVAAGSLKMYYDADWPEVTEDQDSVLSRAEDVACLYYALHRFWRLVASNRGYYKRYATLVGANAVSVSDLQAEADRYLQDFTDARADVTRDAPAFFYRS